MREASRHYAKLLELAEDLKYEANLLNSKARLNNHDPNKTLIANSHYSNALEGHWVAQEKIEAALNTPSDNAPIVDDYLLESIAHIEAERWLQNNDKNLEPHSIDTARQVHREFFGRLPERLRRTDGERIKQIKPGELRDEQVRIGRHIAVEADELPKFIKHFNQGYARLDETSLLVAIAAIHHRFLWIHPFLDGNGRVARLISQQLFDRLLKTSNCWSLSKALYEQQDKYRGLLGQCDQARRNDIDGRGNLSEEALAEFTKFFLATAIKEIHS